jgi:sugar phosphate isomerase/epimerase
MSRGFLEKLEAVAQAGFDGISLGVRDYRNLRAEGMSDADLLAIVRDSGLFIGDVANGSCWRSGDSRDDEDLGIHIVELFGAQALNCTPIDPPFATVDETVGAFGAICDRAARRGVRCQIEFRPWVDPRTLHAAWEVVRRADRSNGGINFDSWHFFRGGGSSADLRAVDPEKIFTIQLADAPAVSRFGDLRTESRNRLLPGHGAGDIAGLIRVMDEIGVDVPFGGEAISPEWADLPPAEGAAALHGALVAVVTAARAP